MYIYGDIYIYIDYTYRFNHLIYYIIKYLLII